MSRRWTRDPQVWAVWFYLTLLLGEAVIDWTIERVETRQLGARASIADAPTEEPAP